MHQGKTRKRLAICESTSRLGLQPVPALVRTEQLLGAAGFQYVSGEHPEREWIVPPKREFKLQGRGKSPVRALRFSSPAASARQGRSRAADAAVTLRCGQAPGWPAADWCGWQQSSESQGRVTSSCTLVASCIYRYVSESISYTGTRRWNRWRKERNSSSSIRGGAGTGSRAS